MNSLSRKHDKEGSTYGQSLTAFVSDLMVRKDPNGRANSRIMTSNTNHEPNCEKNITHSMKNNMSDGSSDRDSDYSDEEDGDFEKRDSEKEFKRRDEERKDEKRRYQSGRPRTIEDEKEGYDEKGFKIEEHDDIEKRDYLKNKLEYLSDIKLSKENVWNILATIKEYLKFVGPGFMVCLK